MTATTITDNHAAELGFGLQLSRAGMMALTRLQLAIHSGDRHQAMAAMDRLHALDAEMERLVNGLPPPEASDGDWRAIAKLVSDQKLAIAFEKLALVSEISGPDLVSEAVTALPRRPADEDAAPPDWPKLPTVEPTEWVPPRPGIIALVLALLVAVALAAAAVLMTAV